VELLDRLGRRLVLVGKGSTVSFKFLDNISLLGSSLPVSTDFVDDVYHLSSHSIGSSVACFLCGDGFGSFFRGFLALSSDCLVIFSKAGSFRGALSSVGVVLSSLSMETCDFSL